ncbi:hypothetical protein IAD21_01754 [Abditibacteriota bacterium]|nr:hypothetical protein IAD21_01754 [Abditibacteriota bacterium]
MKVRFLLFTGIIVAFAAPCVAVCAQVTDEAPDVILERFDGDGRSVESVGMQIFNDDTRQTLASVVSPGQAQNYLIHIKNMGQSATTFQVSLGGLLSPAGAETPWAPKGWMASATSDEQGADILAQLKSEQGWKTPLINLGGETVVRLSLTAPDTTTLPLADGSFRLVARKDTERDAVVGHVGSQFIAKIQWTLNGDKNWHDVTDATNVQILRHEALGVRAEKAAPSAPWGGNEVLGPTWTFQGGSVEGEEVWLEPHATALMGALVTATLGNSKSFQARVLPDPYVTLTTELSIALLAAKATQTQPVLVTVKVEDEEDMPLPQMKVRLRAFSGKNAISSFWTPTDADKDKVVKGNEQILLTNEEGEVKVQWAIAAGVVPLNSRVKLKAEVIDDAGQPFGESDTFNMRVEAAETP